MNTASARIAAAFAVALFAVPLIMLTMMLGDDETSCTPTTSAAPEAAGTPLPTSSKSWPMTEGSYTISDVFGSRGGGHLGVDMAAPMGTPIYAAADGLVADAGPASGFGQWIVVDHNLGGNKVSTVYGHMYEDGVLVRAGDQVRAGQQIALVGSNGQSTGAHLHFEVVPGGRLSGGSQIDPIPWLADAGQPGATTGVPVTTTPAPTTARGPADQAAGDATTPPTSTAAPTTTGCVPTTSGAVTGGGGGDNLADQTEVPEELVRWYRQAGTLCPQISSSLLAAQAKAETGFRRGLTSPSGAQGLGQFMPGTAASASPIDGQPYIIDADGNGQASVWDDGDAIIGQGRYMCAIASTIDGWITEGKVRDSGDRRELYIAAYNAGEGAVLASGGFPSGSPDYVNETRPYVDRILAWEPGFARRMA